MLDGQQGRTLARLRLPLAVSQTAQHHRLVVDDQVAMIALAWARDAIAVSVPSRCTVDGNTLTRHIEFGADIAFPVATDPRWIAGIGTRCGSGADSAMLIYRLFTESRSMSSHFGHAVIGGLGIGRY